MKRAIFIFVVCFICAGNLVFGATEGMQSRFASGMRAMHGGDYDAAISSFQGMLDEDPNLPRVRLELARAYSLSGKRMLAIREFKSVLELNPPDHVRENIERYLNSIGGLPKWSFDFSASYVYDDNVNAGTRNDVVSFYGLPFVLDDSAKQQSDSAITTSFGVNYVAPISDSASWVSSFNFDSTDYLQMNQFNFHSLRGSTGLSCKKGRTIWRFPVVLDYALLGSDRYSGGIGIRPGFSTYLKDGLVVGGSVLLERKQHYFRRDRSGYLSGLDLSARKVLPKDILISVGYQYWMEDTKSGTLSNDTNVLYGSLSKKLSEDLTLRLASVFSWSSYDEGSLAFGDKAREDSRQRFSASLHRSIGKNKELFVEYARTENGSNHDLYEFDRNQVMTGLKLSF